MTLQHNLWPFSDLAPREVQLEALAAANGKSGFALFMRMRLGKTLTAYAEFVNLREEGLVDWFVCICPNTLKEQWREQIESVDAYTPICIYESNNKKRIDWFLKKNKKGGIIIVNYESVRTFMAEEYWNRFNTIKTYLVADESTKIKDPTKKSSKACLELASICSYKRVLTGKPTANSNADIWSQLKFIGATERNYYQHKYYFCIHGGYMGRTVVKNVNVEILQQEMAPHCFIADDKYIKGFEKIYEPLRKVELLPEQRNQYKAMEDSLILDLGDDTEITAPIALTKYLRLQQISSGIAGDVDGNQHNLVDPARNPRIRAVKDILENECSNKTIIICRFKLSIDNLYKELTKEGYKCLKLYGKEGMRAEGLDIDEQKRKFNTEDYDILIAQIQVLSYGHTLCAEDNKPCDTVIHYECDFSLLNRAQCESRPEKYERNGAISHFDFFASKMDRYIMNALIRKEDASTALMGYARSSGVLSQPAPADEDVVATLF